MEQSQSLNYSDIEDDFELDFAVQHLDATFHPNKPDYSTMFEVDANDNGIENAKSHLPDIMTSSLNGFGLAGNDDGLEHADDKPMFTSPRLEDKLYMKNGLDVSYLSNWLVKSLDMTSVDQMDTPAQDTLKNRRHITREDLLLSQNLDLAREFELGAEKRKLTTNDMMDGLDGEAFHALDQNMLQTRAESTNFEATKSTSSVNNNGKENVQTDPSRKRKKTSETTDAEVFSITNFNSKVSSKEMTPPAARERSRRKARTRNRRSETEYFPEFDELSPAPSPEAEVPNVPSNLTKKYVDDDELITLDTKALNKRVKLLPKTVVDEIKHRRRTLKNRGYARSCREKKMTETESLQRSKTDLEKELARKSVELQLALLQRDEWKRKYELLASIPVGQGMNVKLC